MHNRQKTTNFAKVIELDRHIEILLLDNDCVIVPGLGGFMTHHADAAYDKDESLFLPPLRTLGFNPQLRMNDPLLAQSYAEAYDMSYPEAVARIECEVGELKDAIGCDGSYIFNNIGTLSASETGGYEFEPCESGLLTPALYGLSSFECETAHADVTAATQPETSTNGTVTFPTTSTIIPSSDNTGDKADNTSADEPKTICIKVSMLRNVLAAAIIIIAILLIPSPISNTTGTSLLRGEIDSNILTKIMPKNITTGHTEVVDVIKKSADTLIVEHQRTAPAAQKSESIDQNRPTQSDYYCIVLASRVARSSAEAYVSQLKAGGYDQAELYVRGRSVKVTYGKYKSEHEAYNALNHLNDNKPFTEGWVLHVRP